MDLFAKRFLPIYWLAKFVGVYSDLSYNIEHDEYSGDEVEGYDSDGLPVVYSRVIAKLATGSDRIYIEYHEEWFDNTDGDEVPVGMRDGTISYLGYAGYDELGFELPEMYEK